MLSHEPKFSDASKIFQWVEIRLKMRLDRGDQQHQKNDKNVERVKSRSDRRLTIRLIAEKLNLNESTVHHLLTNDLEMRKIFTKLVQN